MDSKIFCIGLSRTGTNTINEILVELGLKGKHFVGPLFRNEWEVVDEYDVLSDSPLPLLFKQCDEKYPNSKFILTTRDKEKWLESMKWMFRHGRVIWNWPVSLGDYHREIYGTNRFKRKVLAVSFDDYHEEVRRYFKDRPQDLLQIKIEDGFNVKELSAFLDIGYKNVGEIHANTRTYASVVQCLSYYSRHYLLYPLKRVVKGVLRRLK